MHHTDQITTQTSISEAIWKKCDQFIHWHFLLKKEVENNYSKEDNYLKNVLAEKSEEYYNQINEMGILTDDFSPAHKKQLFNYFKENGLHELLIGAPFFYHAIYKPRGYAGDAGSMANIYKNGFDGSDPFSKLMNRIGTESLTCQAIRNRKYLVKQAIAGYGKGKVMSLAAGPALEMHEYLNQKKDIEFLALDHDIETLKNFNNNSPKFKYGVINAFHLIKNKYQYLLPKKYLINHCDPKNDFKNWKKYLTPFKYKIKKLQPESFDLIYSIGLYDYIKTYPNPKKGSVALTKILFDLLKPGGRLLIGNISPKQPLGIKWAMECLCDWHLIIRTKEEMLELSDAIPKNEIKSIDVISEELGINWFLDIQKNE